MPTKKKPTQDKAVTTPDRIVPEEPAAITGESGGEPITGESGGEPITGIQLSPEAENFRRVAMEHVARQEAEDAAAAAQVAPPAQLTGPWAIPQIAEIQADWPARRQAATLQVELTESEICEQAHILTAALTRAKGGLLQIKHTRCNSPVLNQGKLGLINKQSRPSAGVGVYQLTSRSGVAPMR